jgi:protein gp37
VSADRPFFTDGHWNKPLKWNAAAAKTGQRRRVFCASMGDVFEDRPDLQPHRARLWTLIESTPTLDWQLLTKRPQNIWQMLPHPWLSQPRSNVWIGTTVEDQRRAEDRCPVLVKVPAAVRFLSCEPLLEAVDVSPWLPDMSWVIVGGESGAGARPFELAWAYQLLEQCHRSGAAYFLKQTGSVWAKRHSGDAKGADPMRWPPDLRVQEFPDASR